MAKRNSSPIVSIDCAIFGYHDQHLKILLVKWTGLGGWGLPGGYIRHEESLSQAANRILEERTGIRDLFLQQFHTFGDSPFRARNHKHSDTLNAIELPVVLPEGNWLLGRQLSIGYYALVDYERVAVSLDFFLEDYQWWDIDEIPGLLFDHNDIVERLWKPSDCICTTSPLGPTCCRPSLPCPKFRCCTKRCWAKRWTDAIFPRNSSRWGC